jgi:hypothetical protein
MVQVGFLYLIQFKTDYVHFYVFFLYPKYLSMILHGYQKSHEITLYDQSCYQYECFLNEGHHLYSLVNLFCH